MSKISNIGDNPNDKMPSGEPLGRDDATSEDGSDRAASNGSKDDDLGQTNEDEDEPGIPAEGSRENQAGSENMGPGKFHRD